MGFFVRQFVKFGITGVINTLIDFGLFNLLVALTAVQGGWKLGLINMFSIAVAASNSYILNRYWTFKSNNDKIIFELGKFAVATAIGMLINSLVVIGISSLRTWTPVSLFLLINVGKLLGAVFSTSWNFLIYRYWVFKAHRPIENMEFLSEPFQYGLTSIVIPAYNEAKRLRQRLIRLAEAIDFPAEIIVVSDGSIDTTLEEACEAAQAFPFISCLSYETNRGKGAAVRTGVGRAYGQYIIFTDADETFGIHQIKQILFRLQSGDDVAIGQRSANNGERVVGESWLRRILGRGFNLYVRLLLLPGIFDTQCGLKGFSREAAREIFTRQKLDGFAFDVEILALARSMNYRVVQVPVTVNDCRGSTVNPLLSPLKMAWDILRVKLFLLVNEYHLGSYLPWWQEAALGTSLFITALALRLPWLWKVPRYIDELKEVNLAYLIYAGKAWPLHNEAHDIGAMHNYILAAFFKIFGPGIYWPRLYVAITAALTVALLYQLGKRMFDRTTGLVAAGLLLTNGMHMIVTHMAWANCTTPFFFVLAMLATVNARKQQSAGWFLTAALFWGTALQTHSSIIIFLIVALVYVLTPAYRRESGLRPRWYVGGGLVFIISYANMIYYNIISQGGSFKWLGNKQYALEHKPGIAAFFNNLEQMFIELMRSLSATYSPYAHLWSYLAQPLFLIFTVLLVWGAYYALKKREVLAVWMMAGGLLIMPWINNRYVFYVATRYIMPVMICAILLAAYAIVCLVRWADSKITNRVRVLVPATVLVMAFIAYQPVPFYEYCFKADNTNLSNHAALETVSIVEKSAGESSIILVDNDLPIENKPLPVLLTLTQKKYEVISNQKTSVLLTDWGRAFAKYRNDEVIAIMSQPTYMQIKNSLPACKEYTVKTYVVFPQTLSQPRTIYILEK